MINVAYITLENDISESIRGIWKIEYTSEHIVFYTDSTKPMKSIAYRADRVFELVIDEEKE